MVVPGGIDAACSFADSIIATKTIFACSGSGHCSLSLRISTSRGTEPSTMLVAAKSAIISYGSSFMRSSLVRSVLRAAQPAVPDTRDVVVAAYLPVVLGGGLGRPRGHLLFHSARHHGGHLKKQIIAPTNDTAVTMQPMVMP